MPTMRLGCSVVAVVFACAAPHANGASDDPEARALRWALTHGTSPTTVPEEVRSLVATLKSDGIDPQVLDRLLAIGEPARHSLARLAAADDAIAPRLHPYFDRLQAELDLVESRRLASSISALVTRGPDALARARRIAPADAPTGWGLPWWAERAHAYRFVPSTDRFVAWEPWALDQTPLRFRGHNRVVLGGSAGLVRWNTPVTVEFWVRWAHRTSAQYLLTDEAWPGMAWGELSTPTKRGFALRRNPRGGGRASLDLTFAIAPDHWFSVESPSLAITDDWEHIAVSSDGSVIRIFRDGRLVAGRSIRSITLLSGMGDLTIGAREHGWPNRVANYDLRALRISEGARYVDDFVPTQALTVDGSTILSPDFRAGPDSGSGRESMTDRVAHSRRHAITGATWTPALDPAAVRDTLAQFGGGTGVPLVFEADRGGRSSEWYLAERAGQSEGINAEIYSERDPDDLGHWITIPIKLASTGRYRVHLLGAGLERAGKLGLVSPFSWRVDEGAWTPVTEATPTIRSVGGGPYANRPDAALSPLGEVALDAGEHLFRLRLLARRTRDGRYSMWLDGLVLETMK